LRERRGPFRPRSYWLDVKLADFDRNGSHDEVEGQNHAKFLLAAREDAFHSGEGAGDQADAISYFEKWVGLSPAYQAERSQRLDVFLRQCGRMGGSYRKADYSGQP